MNKRTMSIILDLNKEKDLTISDLADRCQVSARTIRNDINAINALLAEHGLSELKLKSGGLIAKGADFGELLSHMGGSDFYTYKLSQDERKKVAASLLINSSEYITLSTIADNLYVSRATIINDLEDIKDFIRKGNLEVISHPNKGLRVEGRETDKRKFLMRLVTIGNVSQAPEALRPRSQVMEERQSTIRKIVSEQERAHKRYLTDESFQGIVQYLGIMVDRISQGEYIEPQTCDHAMAYDMAGDVLKYIAQYCNVAINQDEIGYFANFLARVRYIKKKSCQNQSVKIQTITRQFIEGISEDLGENLNRDYDFFENLSNHLESIFGIDNPVYKPNEIVDQVMEGNPQVVEAVRKYCGLLQHYCGRQIGDTELGYIVIHVCAALERRKNKEIAFHVVVACHAGVGTSQLLMERLKKHFNFQIVDVISAHNAPGIDSDKVDFVIATVPLTNCPLPYVTVSPLLTDEDYLKIGRQIDDLRASRHLMITDEEKSEPNPDRLIEEIQGAVTAFNIDKESQLMAEIRRVVRTHFGQTVEDKEQAPALRDLLTADHIQLDVSCRDWRDAVTKSAAPLLEADYIEYNYIKAMIANIEENGPYVVISKGFALPHEGVDMGTKKLGMNLIRLKKPVSFEADELDPVEFVCCLSAVDHKSHLRAFFNLVNLLKQEEIKEAMRQCRTSEEMADVIASFEQKLN